MKRSVWLFATSLTCVTLSLSAPRLVPSALAAPPATPPVAAPKAPVGPAGVAATVNGTNITNSEVERALTAVKERNEKETGIAPTSDQIAQYRQSVIDVLVTNRLMAQAAAKENIVPPKTEVDALMTDFKQNNNLKDDGELKTYLAKENKTPEDLRRLFSEQLATNKLASEWIADVTVSEADIAGFYNKNPDLFKESDAVHIRRILLIVAPGATDAQRAAVKTKATQLLQKAKAKNADFGALAKANSDDPGSREQGGDVGWLEPGTMVKAFDDAAFGSPVGSVVGPVETDFGYEILQIKEKRPAGIIALAEVKNDPRLKEVVLGQKRQMAVKAKLTALKAGANIQIFG